MCRKSICCCQSNIRTKLCSVYILQVFDDLSAQTQLAGICRWKRCSFWWSPHFFNIFISIFYKKSTIPPLLRFRKHLSSQVTGCCFPCCRPTLEVHLHQNFGFVLPLTCGEQQDRSRTFDKSDLRGAAARCYCAHHSSVFTLMKLPTKRQLQPPDTADISQPVYQQVPPCWNASSFAEL